MTHDRILMTGNERMTDGTRKRSLKWLLLVLSVAAFLTLAAGGYWFNLREARSIRSEKYSSLKVVAEMKLGQILAWRNECLADARLNSSGILRRQVLRWLKAPADESLKVEILDDFKIIREDEGYQNIILATPDGRLLFSAEPKMTELEANAKELLARAVASRAAVFGDLFRCPGCHEIHLDVATPLFDADGRPAAVLILRADPEDYLYPLIRSWPIPSKSAETLLVRRDGDDALVLNELRFRPGPALTIRIPMSSSDVPSSQAILGKTGIFEGTDYRGVDVLADLLPVLGSPWFMVAKVDMSEILAEVQYRHRMIMLLVVLGILMTGVMAALIHHYRQRKLSQSLYLSERERREELEKNSRNDAGLRSLAHILQHQASNTQEFLDFALDEAIKLTLSKIGYIYFYSEDKKQFVLNTRSKEVMKECTIRNPQTCRELDDTGIGGEAVRQRRPIVLNDFQAAHPLKKGYPEGHAKLHKYMTVPLFSGDRIVAVVGVANKETDYDETDVLQLSLLMDATWKVVERRQAEERERAAQAETQRLLEAAERPRRVLLSVVEDQKMAEDEIRKLNAELEQRVRERTAQLEAANKDLEAFTYSVSHDLRAPLRGINGWSLALEEDYYDKIDEKGRQYLSHVRSETQHMSGLIDDLLKFSRETRIEMKRQQVDMTALAQTVASRLRQANPASGVEFVIQPGLTGRADSHLLEIVLTNLLDNAVKFSGTRAQALIEFGQTEQNAQKVFFVRDNGVGFDMAYGHKLFNVFQRLHKQSEFPGTGIGLAIVRRIINRHGGLVWAEAQPDQGATFYFTLKEVQ
jgi:signal transduction histidine kinase